VTGKGDQESDGGAGAGAGLRVRVASALALGALSVGLLWAGPWPFAVLLIAIALGVAWEWGRLVRNRERDIVLYSHGIATAGAIVLGALDLGAIALIALMVVALVLLVLRIGQADWLSGAGVLYVGLPALSLVWLRSAPELGFLAVLLIFIVVWTSDSFAFATGRMLGGPRLWPSVSPGKTWAGAIGGAAAATLAGVLFALILDDVRMRPLDLGLVALGLSIAAQLGDLAESALKRRAGRKDASALIPGHGGLLDRVDGLMLASSVAGLLALMRDPIHPALALMSW
jgi:phosphatidate cytidylyltransferase